VCAAEARDMLSRFVSAFGESARIDDTFGRGYLGATCDQAGLPAERTGNLSSKNSLHPDFQPLFLHAFSRFLTILLEFWPSLCALALLARHCSCNAQSRSVFCVR